MVYVGVGGIVEIESMQGDYLGCLGSLIVLGATLYVVLGQESIVQVSPHYMRACLRELMQPILEHY